MAKQEKDALLEKEYDAPLPVSPMLQVQGKRASQEGEQEYDQSGSLPLL